MKKAVKYMLGLLCIIGMAGFYVYSSSKPIEVDGYAAARKQAQTYFIEEGIVKADEKVEVYALSAGEVLSISVAEGQTVKAGDVLCTIDSSALQLELDQVKSTIDGYKAQVSNIDLEEKRQKDSLAYNLKSLQSEYSALLAQENTADISKDEQLRLQNILIKQSEADLETAKQALSRVETLYKSGAASQKELDDGKKAVEEAQSALDTNLQQSLLIDSGQNTTEYYKNMKASLEAQISGIENSIEKSYSQAMKRYYESLANSAVSSSELLYNKMRDCIVKSPADGKIDQLYVKNSNIVNPAMPVASITVEQAKEIEVYVSTKDIDAIAVSDEVELTINRSKGDYMFKGTIRHIDSEATLKLSSLGVEQRKIKVIIHPDEKDSALLQNGYDVSVKFITYKEEDQIVLPKTAVFKDIKTEEQKVFVIRDGKLTEQVVELGMELRTEYVIKSGVNENDVVVKDANMAGLKENKNAVARY